MPPTPPTERSPIIRVDRDTLVPIGLLISIVMTAVGAVWWLSATINNLTSQQREAWFVQQTAMLELRGRMDGMQAELRLLSTQVHSSGDDRWRASDMRAWAELLKAKNPTMEIPVPARGE